MHFQLTESFNSYRPNCVFSSSSPLAYFHLLVRSPLDESVPFRERRETKRKPLLEYCPQDFLLFRLWFRWCAVECTLWIGRQAPEQVLSETIFGKWIECKSVNEIESCILLGHASINIISGTSRFDRAPVRCHSSEKAAEKKNWFILWMRLRVFQFESMCTCTACTHRLRQLWMGLGCIPPWWRQLKHCLFVKFKRATLSPYAHNRISLFLFRVSSIVGCVD